VHLKARAFGQATSRASDELAGDRSLRAEAPTGVHRMLGVRHSDVRSFAELAWISSPSNITSRRAVLDRDSTYSSVCRPDARIDSRRRFDEEHATARMPSVNRHGPCRSGR